MKKALQTAMKFGAKGIRVALRRPPRRRRDEPRRDVPRGSRAAAHAARRHRVRHRRGPHDLRRSSASRCWIFKGEVLPRASRAASAVIVKEQRRSCFPRSAPSSARQQKGKQPRHREGAASDVVVRRLRPAGARAGLPHVAPDRGGSYGDHPPRQARRQALDPRLPGQARSRRSRSRSAWVPARAPSRSGSPSSARAA